jgi:hypothetical protein
MESRSHIANVVAACVGGAVLLLGAPRLATAQTGAPPAMGPAVATPAPGPAGAPPDVCFRFMFGAWSPPLDWRAAGHRAPPDSSSVASSSTGRGAAAEISVGADSALLLLPGWWPAGVLVELPTRTPAPGDTVVGRASAFVADGSVAPPVSRVRAWRVECK